MVNPSDEPRELLAKIVRHEHVSVLTQAGFVSAERLPSGHQSYKLRYRIGGRQVVVRLGADPARATAAADALEWVQRRTRQSAFCISQIAEIRRSFRNSRRLLALAARANAVVDSV